MKHILKTTTLQNKKIKHKIGSIWLQQLSESNKYFKKIYKIGIKKWHKWVEGIY